MKRDIANIYLTLGLPSVIASCVIIVFSIYHIFDSDEIDYNQGAITIPQSDELGEYSTIHHNELVSDSNIISFDIEVQKKSKNSNNKSDNYAIKSINQNSVKSKNLETKKVMTKIINLAQTIETLEQIKIDSDIYKERNTHKLNSFGRNQPIYCLYTYKCVTLKNKVMIYERADINAHVITTIDSGEKIELISPDSTLNKDLKNKYSAWAFVRYKNKNNKYIHGYVPKSSLQYAS